MQHVALRSALAMLAPGAIVHLLRWSFLTVAVASAQLSGPQWDATHSQGTDGTVPKAAERQGLLGNSRNWLAHIVEQPVLKSRLLNGHDTTGEGNTYNMHMTCTSMHMCVWSCTCSMLGAIVYSAFAWRAHHSAQAVSRFRLQLREPLPSRARNEPHVTTTRNVFCHFTTTEQDAQLFVISFSHNGGR